MDIAAYGIFVLCLICAAAAIWQLYTSSEERAERGSFLYKYAAFFAYILLAVIFGVILSAIPRTELNEAFIKMVTAPTLGPVGSFAFSKAAVANSVPKSRKNSLLG
jgi:hypothetical protein